MRCLCCGKELSADRGEDKVGWHRSCVKKFFGVSELPQIVLTDDQMEMLARKTVAKGMTVPGVQKKISLHLSVEDGARLTLVDYPTGFILKPQSEEFPYLPESEALAMRMAEKSGIRTVPYALIRTPGASTAGSLLEVSWRIRWKCWQWRISASSRAVLRRTNTAVPMNGAPK